MKLNLLLIIPLFALCACNTVKGTLVNIDKEHAVDGMIYDLVENYNVPEIGTVFDYSMKVDVVTGCGDCVMYKAKIGKTWYDINKSTFDKYHVGDIVKQSDMKQIKK